MNFEFPAKAKTLTFVLMAIGLVAMIWGFFLDGNVHDHVEGVEQHVDHQRWWANILINGFFFFGIAVAALFFFALQYAAEVAWSAQLVRLFQAIYSFLPIAGAVIVIVILVGQFHGHHIYHWMDDSLYHEAMIVDGDNINYDVELSDAGAVANPNYDPIIANKKAYLNMPFFWVRTIAYLAVFLIFAHLFKKWSRKEDEIGGTELHYKMYRRGALFLVFFAVFSSMLSWDWLMSIDTHWFSTLYGWYVFSGMWVTSMIVAVITALWLKSKGYLPKVNESHIHDLGKWMFGISMLWAYLWFSQFMLIWYADIPEEVKYFQERIMANDHYMIIYMSMFFVNFLVPFYFLMSRESKRNPTFLAIVGAIIFVAHFLDVYMLVIPGTVFNHFHGMKLYEWGMFIGFLGLFIHVLLRSLTKAPLVPKNHPLLGESEHHHI